MTSPTFSAAGAEALVSNSAHARRLMRAGWWVIVVAIVPIGIWICGAPLATAVIAPAVVKVDLNRRPVQHLEGGIIREVLVRDGQRVKAGEPIVILGDVRVDADRNRLRYRVNVERAGVARLEAEQAMARHIAFPNDLTPAARRDERVSQALGKESALFAARRDTMLSHIALLKIQREKVAEERVTVRAQIAQASDSLALQRRELDTNRNLLKDGFISPTRIVQMEAVVADYAAKLEERRTELTRAEQRQLDIDLKIKSIQNDYTKTASDELKVTAAQVAEIEQELRKSDDAAERQVVIAPADGEIIDLKFNTPGAVVGPREPIADIVPSDARLVIEARVRTEDINSLQQGQAAKIKLTSLKYQNGFLLEGKLFYVSADRLTDRLSGEPYYTALIEADSHSLESADNLKLQAGMPAEVYIQGATQTPLEYLLEPVTTTIRRAGRQL